MTTAPVGCSDHVEVGQDGETAAIDETIATMRHTLEQTFELQVWVAGRAARSG